MQAKLLPLPNPPEPSNSSNNNNNQKKKKKNSTPSELFWVFQTVIITCSFISYFHLEFALAREHRLMPIQAPAATMSSP